MPRSPQPSLFASLSLAGALALAAGAALPVPALAEQPTATPQVQAAIVGRTLLVNGQQVYTSAGRISNSRVITFAGSPTVLIVWDEQRGAQRFTSFALSRHGRGIDSIGSTENQVRLRYATFDPAEGEPAIPGHLAAGENNELFLVQFVATPLEEMRREITAMGGSVLRFLTENTHLIRMPAETRARVSNLPYVRWIGAYHPVYRLDTDIVNALQGNARAGQARYSIEVTRSGMAEQQQVADIITRLGGVIDVVTPDQYRMEATLTHDQLVAVMQLNMVNYIDPWRGPGGTDMDIIRQLGNAVPLLSSQNFLGQGVRGEIFDTEVQSNHPQWGGQIPLVHGTNGNSGFHGSACYGINFATGTGNLQATGLMPQREQGIFYWYPQVTQFGGSVPRLTANTEATDPTGPYRSVFQTSSVGSPQISNYSSISAETDDYLFRVDYLSCQSQSNLNSTSSRPQAWAKNIVAVGGVQHNNTLTRADDGPSGASFGPAADGRMKPELAHCYDAIFTTNNSSGYTDFGGTSGATPITAGHFGLLHQMWHEGVFQGFGGGSSVFASRPKSYTARALMINTAYRYPLTQLNRARQGWGMVDMTRLYNDRSKFFIVNGDDPLVNGQTRTYDLLVIGGEPEFRITMVYPDPMGNPAAAQARINDLTLKVTDPNGIVYWGNNAHMSNNYTPPGGAANTIDTVENVFIQNPVAGNWTVQVIASQIVQDGYLATPAMDAVYSLVASNVTLGPPPPTGACCLPDAPCAIMSQANCTSLNGIYRGDNSACATANCPPVGACCFTDGTCAGMSEAACIAAGGTYRGDNTICATANCTGACCFADGTCSVLSPTQCAALNGNYAGGGTTCATANCPQPPGLYTYSGPPVPIIDGSGTNTCGPTAVAEIIVPDSFTVTSAQAGVNIETGWQGDVRFRLSKGGVSVYLANRPGIVSNPPYGFDHENYGAAPTPAGAMRFNDGAPIFYDSPATSGMPNVTGLWKPRTGTMADFVGMNAQGAWRLEAEDCAGGIPGTIIYFNILLGGQNTITCYANCDGSTTVPFLNVADFGCFLSKFAAGDSYANCDGSTTQPVLNVADFGCFLSKFAAGCSAP